MDVRATVTRDGATVKPHETVASGYTGAEQLNIGETYSTVLYDPLQDRFVPKEDGDSEVRAARIALDGSYASLLQDLKALIKTKPTRKDIEKLTQQWSAEDALIVVEGLRTSSKERQLLVAAFKSYNQFLETTEGPVLRSTGMIWGVLAHVVESLYKITSVFEHVVEFFNRVRHIFEEAMDALKLIRSSELPLPLILLESCFVDSLRNLLKFAYTKKTAFAAFTKSFALQDQLEKSVSGMKGHVDTLRVMERRATHQQAQSLEQEVSQIHTSLVQMRAQLESEQSQMFKVQLYKMFQDRMQDTGVDRGLKQTREETLDKFLTSPGPEPAVLEPVTVEQSQLEDDKYVTYIDNTLIEHLEHRRTYLSEEFSHVSIKLLDRPKVTTWIESETSAFLWIEGYVTGAPLKWTSEFSLDVIHAAQDRGYAVLYHFCELMTTIGGTLRQDQNGTLAMTTILKTFLCLAGSQCSHHFSSKFDTDILSARKVAELDDATTEKMYEECLAAFKPGTILYIVIDSVDDLEQWTGGRPSIKKWLEKLMSTAHEKEHIVVKILFTSCTSVDKPAGNLKLWTDDEHTESQSSDQDAAQTVRGSSAKNTGYITEAPSMAAASQDTTSGGGLMTRPPLPRSFDSIQEDKKSTSMQALARHFLQNAVKPSSTSRQVNPKPSPKAKQEDM